MTRPFDAFMCGNGRLAEILESAVAPAPVGLYAKAAGPEQLRPAVLTMAARLAPEHPSLRWQVNGALLAHRRLAEDETVCGRQGALEVVTDPLVPHCPKCYRHRHMWPITADDVFRSVGRCPCDVMAPMTVALAVQKAPGVVDGDRVDEDGRIWKS